MIIKLHGTSGAGKSTIAYGFLNKAKSVSALSEKGKIKYYAVDHPDLDRPLYVLGRYESACGGCDTLKAAEQIDLLDKCAPHGHVLYEGLLASEYYGALGAASEQYGDNHIFAFLDTPIEVCIERVKARRLAAGNDKPLNEENTRGRIKKIEALKRRLTNMGRVVVDVDHTQAYEDVLHYFQRNNDVFE
jgi:hypothetical protein